MLPNSRDFRVVPRDPGIWVSDRMDSMGPGPNLCQANSFGKIETLYERGRAVSSSSGSASCWWCNQSDLLSDDLLTVNSFLWV